MKLFDLKTIFVELFLNIFLISAIEGDERTSHL